MMNKINDLLWEPSGLPEQAKIVILNRAQLQSPSDFNHHQIQLPKELKKASQARRLDYLAGRAAATLAAQQLGFEKPKINRCRKTGEPLWQAGLTGSITHKSLFAGAAVCLGAALAVGLDIEVVANKKQQLAIEKKAFNSEENLLKTHLPPEAFASLLFSAKESLYKALFPQVKEFFGFDRASLICVSEETFKLRLERSLGGPWTRDREFKGFYQQERGHVFTCLFIPLDT